MTREEAIKIMQTERACVLKATSTFAPCNRECYSCNLYLDRLEIAGAYTTAIEALQERPKGRWRVGTVMPWNGVAGNWKCSVCNKTSLKDSNFCPNCGADMREVSE